MSRVTYLQLADLQLLDDWAASLGVRLTLPIIGVYLVGSSLERADYRDVDVRVVMDDQDYEAHAGVWETWNLGMSLWAQRATALPVDCQAAPLSESEKHLDRPTPRPLGGLGRT